MAVRAYVSAEHGDAPGTGGPGAALASEVGRHRRATRRTFASHVEPTLDALAVWLPSRRWKEVGRASPAAFIGAPPGTPQLPPAAPHRPPSPAIPEARLRSPRPLPRPPRTPIAPPH